MLIFNVLVTPPRLGGNNVGQIGKRDENDNVISFTCQQGRRNEEVQ